MYLAKGKDIEPGKPIVRWLGIIVLLSPKTLVGDTVFDMLLIDEPRVDSVMFKFWNDIAIVSLKDFIVIETSSFMAVE
jgi:hypothetical protein